MKLVEKTDATGSLAEYATNIEKGPVIVTDHGSPVAALVPIDNADLETVTLSTNQQFLELIDRSRRRVTKEGTVSSEDMRRKFQSSGQEHAEQSDERKR